MNSRLSQSSLQNFLHDEYQRIPFYDSCFVNSMSIYSCKVLEYRKAETKP